MDFGSRRVEEVAVGSNGSASVGSEDILCKDRERESTAYLDTAGVRDRSKVVVVEDVKAQAKRCLETRRAATSVQAAKSIAKISLEVDKLASKVKNPIKISLFSYSFFGR